MNTGEDVHRVWWSLSPTQPAAKRKIHLDYHNSEHVSLIADAFDATEFAATLKAAHVDSVVLFAKDMHGYFYYPSVWGPEHPALRGRDLFGEQARACKEAGIEVFAYYCTTWDNNLANTHPEWLSIKRDGSNYLPRAGETPGWTALCMSNEPFVELMLNHTSEVLELYAIDGLWYDMPVTNANQECFCKNCLEFFKVNGLDPFDREVQGQRTEELLLTWLERSKASAVAINPDLIVDQNQQTRLSLAERAPFLANVDVEALPTGEWGYWYFPIMARYVRALSLPFTGLTGRFQTSWADFGGLKSRAQLRVEVAAIVASGGGVSVGDQLHPSGKLDKAVYRRVGDAYAYIDEVEEYLAQAVPVSEAVLLVAGEPCNDFARIETQFEPAVRAGALGLAKLLVEHRIQFDVAEPGTIDLNRYGLVVIPDGLPLSPDSVAAIEVFLQRGGKVLHSSHPGQQLASAPWLETLGIVSTEASEFIPAYMRFESGSSPDFDSFDFALYQGSAEWSTGETADAHVIARLGLPAFQRSSEHYTSHAHSSFDHLTDHPVALANTALGAVSFPLGRAYFETGYWVYSTVFERILQSILPSTLIGSDAPSSVELSLTYQADPFLGSHRMILHAVNFTSGRRRGDHLEYLDEIVPVHDLRVRLRVEGEVRGVRTARLRQDLEFSSDGTSVRFLIPRVDIHEIVIIELAEALHPR